MPVVERSEHHLDTVETEVQLLSGAPTTEPQPCMAGAPSLTGPLSRDSTPNPAPGTACWRNLDGVIAQLGERRNGIAKVRGSIPRGSTNFGFLNAGAQRPLAPAAGGFDSLRIHCRHEQTGVKSCSERSHCATSLNAQPIFAVVVDVGHHATLPRWRRGFDSRRPHQKSNLRRSWTGRRATRDGTHLLDGDCLIPFQDRSTGRSPSC